MKNQERLVKKLGEPRTETVKIDLADAERQTERATACDLRDQAAAVKEEKKTAMAAFGQRLKELDLREQDCRRRASTGIDHVAVIVQDYLTGSNEVVSVKVDTNEPVARRTATVQELQEEMFGGSGGGETVS